MNKLLIFLLFVSSLFCFCSCEKKQSAVLGETTAKDANKEIKNSLFDNANNFQESNSKNKISKSAKFDSDDTASVKKRITGKWIKKGETECYCGQCLEIQFEKQIDNFCVENNQIFVSGNYQLDAAGKKVKFYFKDPTDLGVGGAKLPWENFNRKKPIAVIDISKLEKNTINIKWAGFKTNKRTGRSKYDFGKRYQGIYQKLD